MSVSPRQARKIRQHRPFVSRLRKWRGAVGFSVSLIATATALNSSPAHAYDSIIDTGDLVNAGHYQATFEPQLIFSRYDGANVIGHLDTGLTEESSLRGTIGIGAVDFHMGASLKYVPFPDTASQPAIGGRAGLSFARVEGSTEFNIRFEPLVSKRFSTEVGDLTAYGSIPFGVTTRSEPDDTVFPIHLTGGVQLQPLNTPHLSYFTELGLDLNDAFSYISFAVAFRFDDASIRRRRK